MSSPLEYYANLPLTPEALAEQVEPDAVQADSLDETVVATVGDVNLTRAEVAEAVQLAVAGAVESAVSGAVRSAVAAAVKANVNPLEAETRFKQKYLGVYPAATSETEPPAQIVEVPRIILSESGVPTVALGPTSGDDFEVQSVRVESAEQKGLATLAVESFEVPESAEIDEFSEETGEMEATAFNVAAVAVELTDPLETADPADGVMPADTAEPEQEIEPAERPDAVEGVVLAEKTVDFAAAAPAVEPEALPAVEPEALPAVEPEIAPAVEPEIAPAVEPVEKVAPARPITAVEEPAAPASVASVPAAPVLQPTPASAETGTPTMRESRLRDEKSVQFVGFLVGTQMYAVPSVLIKEVIRRQPTNRLPVHAQYVTGVINLRGQVMPLVSLRELLLTDMPKDGVCNQFSIITGQGNMLFALEVDRIRSMYVIQQEEIVWNVSGVLGLDDDSVIGLFELNERLVPILSMERVAAILLEEGLDMASLSG